MQRHHYLQIHQNRRLVGQVTCGKLMLNSLEVLAWVWFLMIAMIGREVHNSDDPKEKKPFAERINRNDDSL